METQFTAASGGATTLLGRMMMNKAMLPPLPSPVGNPRSNARNLIAKHLFESTSPYFSLLSLCLLFAVSASAQRPDGVAIVEAQSPTYTIIDTPDAGTSAGQGTLAEGINTAGNIVGSYLDSSAVYHGFLRAKSGAITVIDAPGAGAVSPDGTTADALNSAGVVSGTYFDSNDVPHGYVRSTAGVFTDINVKGAGNGKLQGTSGGGINTA